MSANLERDRTHLVRWLDECGLSSTEGSVSVTLVTDSEQSVSTFVARSSGKYELLSLLCSSMHCCGLGWVGGPLGLPTSRSSFGVFSVVHFSVAVFSCTLC